MARSLTGIRVVATLQATLGNTLDGNAYTASVAQGFTRTPATALSTGTSANQADRIWQDTARALASGGTEDLDLYDLGSLDIDAGSGRDGLGQLFTLAALVAICIENKSTSAGTLQVGGKGNSTAFTSIFGANTDIIKIRPGGLLLLFAPTDPAYAIVDTTNHILKMEASGGAVTYDIALLGRSA